MKANCWISKNKVRVEEVPDPQILNAQDVIVRITSTAICGSDLHLYNGFVPSMMKGDILGHEFMGEVVEVGREVTKLKVGDRVVVPFPIACGSCWSCEQQLYSLCENSNPNASLAEKMWGHSPAGIFGYSHLTGGYAGGQAEYARVPFADVGPLKIENGFSDEQVLFLSDIFPTGYMAAENCNIQPGDTVAVHTTSSSGAISATFFPGDLARWRVTPGCGPQIFIFSMASITSITPLNARVCPAAAAPSAWRPDSHPPARGPTAERPGLNPIPHPVARASHVGALTPPLSPTR